MDAGSVGFAGGAPNWKGNGEGEDAGGPTGLEGAPNGKSEVGAGEGTAGFSAGLPNVNGLVDGAVVEGVSLADSGALDGSGEAEGAGAELFGKTETGSLLPKPMKGDASAGLPVSALLFSSAASVLVWEAIAGAPNKLKVDLGGASSLAAEGLLKNEDASFTAAAEGVAVVGGSPKEKVEGTLTCALGFDNAVEVAKKFGTADEPLPVRLASSCSAAGCFGAVASTEELPGLGGISAICGTVLMRGVKGAGANTD